MSWTLFRWFGSSMYLVVAFLLFGTWYVLLFKSLVPSFATSPVATCVAGVFYHAVFLCAVASYVKVCATFPGSVPESFLLRSDASSHKLCRACNRPKPLRSHHCDFCGGCILKMDHHCPWINVCVGFRNQKFFFQFLTYIVLTCIIGVAILLATIDWRLFSSTDPDRDLLTPLLQIVSLAVGVSLGLATLALFSMHAMLLCKNLTGSEHSYGATPNPFDLGSRMANISQVMGPFSLANWLLPIGETPGNGIDWPTNNSGGGEV
jgi:hypothetical protein